MTPSSDRSIPAPVAPADLDAFVASSDIVSLGMVADEARRARHGARTTFVRVAEIPIDGSSLPTWPFTAGELTLVGAPAIWDRALQQISGVLRNAGSIPVSAFSLADLERVAKKQERPLQAVLEEAKSTGLEWMAEVPIDELQDVRMSFAALTSAGLRAARLTVHTTQGEAAVSLLRTVRAIVAEGADVRAFAPLPRVLPSEPSTGYQDVKQVAIARLLLDNVPSIQVHWTLYGPKLAQVALAFGADDVDGVPPGDDPNVGRRRQPLEEIRRNIEACGQTPIERNGRFEPVER